MKEFKEWDGFEGKIWKEEINTRDFIQKNYTPYDGDKEVSDSIISQKNIINK